MVDSMTCNSQSASANVGKGGHSENTRESIEKKILLARLAKLAQFLYVKVYGVPDSPGSSSTSQCDTAVEKPTQPASLQNLMGKTKTSNEPIVPGKELPPCKEADQDIPCSSSASGSDLHQSDLDGFQREASSPLKLKIHGTRQTGRTSLCSHHNRIFCGNYAADHMKNISPVSTAHVRHYNRDNGPKKQNQNQTESRSNVCRFCDKIFHDLSQLRYHEQTHTGSKSFKCRVCPKAFSQSSNLKVHERMHYGSRPFKCSLCPKAFSRSSNLKRHERTHSGSRPFKCSLCPKAFSRSSHLKVHERMHSGSRPFSCSLCPKAFSNSSDLKRHERTHSCSRPFQCSLCPKAFSRSSNLKVHERTHSGSRPFQCSLCSKAFSQSSNLKAHKRTHSGSRRV